MNAVRHILGVQADERQQMVAQHRREDATLRRRAVADHRTYGDVLSAARAHAEQVLLVRVLPVYVVCLSSWAHTHTHTLSLSHTHTLSLLLRVPTCV